MKKQRKLIVFSVHVISDYSTFHSMEMLSTLYDMWVRKNCECPTMN